MQHYCWYKFDKNLCILKYVFYMQNPQNNVPHLRVTTTSIKGKLNYNRHYRQYSRGGYKIIKVLYMFCIN